MSGGRHSQQYREEWGGVQVGGVGGCSCGGDGSHAVQ